MKAISLLPQEKSKKPHRQITSTGNQLNVVESKQSVFSYEFDAIFKTISDEVLSFEFSKPTTFVCLCASGAFEKRTISNTINSITNGLFQSSGSKPGKLKIMKYDESNKIEELMETVDFNNSNESSDLFESVFTELEMTQNFAIYVSLQIASKIDIYFLPVLSSIFDDLLQMNSKASSGNKLMQEIKASLDSSTSKMFDFRFGYNCPFQENKKLLDSVDLIKEMMSVPRSSSSPSRAPSEAGTKITAVSSQVSVASTASRMSQSSIRSNKSQPQSPQPSEKDSKLTQSPSQKSVKSTKSNKPPKTPKWKEFITRPVKGPDGKPKMRGQVKVTYVDRSRLVNVAQKYAYDPNATKEDLEALLEEMDKQIMECQEYHQGIGDVVVKLNEDVKILRDDEKVKAKTERDLRQHLMELKAYNKSDENAHNSIMIGSKEDYKIAYDCLKEEVDALEKELEFLRLAFPDIEESEEESNDEEEEQEGKAQNQQDEEEVKQNSETNSDEEKSSEESED